ncbi:MAG: Gfo/Idh/MocA family oxidoreductase [Paracoccaceae bacterium]
MAPLNVVVVGLGYFSQFHMRAWVANPNARLAAVCDTNTERATKVGNAFQTQAFFDISEMLENTEAQIVDIVAPPSAHAELVRASLAPDRVVICQKPFCKSIAEAEAVIAEADAVGAQIVIHENFRFQPWHREIKDFLDQEKMGTVWQARFALRPGDGRGADAYLSRQPAFQTMPRLLIQETGVHFLDLFRWMFGDVKSIYCEIRRLNFILEGEDAGFVIMEHETGTRSVFDGNRLGDLVTNDPRRTMGVMDIEGDTGTLSLDSNGRLWLRKFGERTPELLPLTRPMDARSFGGGCVAALIDHVVDATLSGETPENTAHEYLPVMHLTEAAYTSADQGQKIKF